MFAFVVPYLCNENIVLVAEIVVVFHFACQEHVGMGSYGLGQQEGSCSSTEGDGLDEASRHARMFYTAHLEQLLDPAQEIGFGFRFFQLTYDARSCLCPFILQGIEVVGRFLVRMYFDESFCTFPFRNAGSTVSIRTSCSSCNWPISPQKGCVPGCARKVPFPSRL